MECLKTEDGLVAGEQDGYPGFVYSITKTFVEDSLCFRRWVEKKKLKLINASSTLRRNFGEFFRACCVAQLPTRDR